MKNIEITIIGDQAKRLREYAGVSIEELSERIDFEVDGLKDFEQGRNFNFEETSALFALYLQNINYILAKQKRSFLKTIENFCAENSLDSESLMRSFYDDITDLLMNNPEKSELRKHLRDSVEKSYTVVDAFQGSMKEALGYTKGLVEVVNVYKKKYKETHQDFVETHSKLNILYDAIRCIEDKSELISAIEELFEMDKEHDFPNDTEQSYFELLEELKELENI